MIRDVAPLTDEARWGIDDAIDTVCVIAGCAD